MDMSLWKITDEVMALDQLIEEQQGECCAVTEEFAKEIEKLITQKTDNCVEFVKSLDEQVEVVQKRISELSALAKSIEHKRKRILDYVHSCMQKINKDEISGDLYRFTIVKSPTSLIIENENEIPPQYLNTKIDVCIDKKQLLADMKNGVNILGARLQNDKTYLKIATKRINKKKEINNE